MITIRYSPDKHELKLNGHAGAGRKGRDTVCAAASMIFYNLAAMFRNYPEEAFRKPVIMRDSDSDTGVSMIKADPKAEYEQLIDHDFLFALTGFEQLAGNFPDKVCLIVKRH